MVWSFHLPAALVLTLVTACAARTVPRTDVTSPEVRLAERHFPVVVGAASPGPRFRLLSRAEYANTVRGVADIDVDELARTLDPEPLVDEYTTFARHGVVDERRAEQYGRAARRLAAAVLEAAGPCEGACAQRLYRSVASRVYRRPLFPDESARLDTFFRLTSAEVGAETALSMVVESLFRAPAFLFRSEAGAGAAGALSDDEIASALAYGITAAPPDATLQALARAGRLRDGATRAAEVARLLRSPAGRAVFFQFVAEWLGISHVQGREKSARLFPGWNADIGRAVKAETRRFVEHVLANGGLGALLTAPWSFPPPALRALYGLPPAEGGDRHAPPDAPVPLPAGERAGILTQASFLAAHSTKTETALTERGVLLASRVLCDRPPPPPPDVPPLPQADGVFRTKRHRLERHATDPVCASCHESFDPLGYALESYDAVGRFRREEDGAPIDPSGEVIFPGDGIRQFADAVELTRLLAAAPTVHQCFVRQLFRFYQGRGETPADHPALRASFVALRTSGLDMRRALATLFAHDSFILREPTTKEARDHGR